MRDPQSNHETQTMAEEEQQLPDIRLDGEQLYREDNFTDRRVGTLRRLTPVTSDGSDDPSRSVVFEGQASLMTPGGALPLHFEIEATSIEEALAKYPEVAQQALLETLEEMQRMRREQQGSGIIAPGQGGGGGMGGGMPGQGGGMPGGGNIQL